MELHQCFQIACLLAKRKTGSVTPEEERILTDWKKERNHRQVWNQINNESDYVRYQQELKLFPPEERWNMVKKELRSNKRLPFGRRWLRYAAAILLIACSGGGFYFHYQSRTEYSQNETWDCPAGTNSAQLVLSNNEIIFLPTESKHTYNELQGIRILQGPDGITFLPQEGLSDTLIHNQIRTLQGMEYHITLTEGTKIHMNAESKLVHPLLFQDAERIVQFEGEAYFAVAKDVHHPFVITLGPLRLHVLGTTFNVRAYPDEDEIQVTLEEGSLEMDGHRIQPGEQIIYNKKTSRSSVRPVDTKEFVAWHEGHFLFRNERLEDILRTLARWYDFSYRFEDEDVKNVRIGAYLGRYDSMQPIIDLFRRTELVNISIKNDIIYFSSKHK